MYTNTRSRDICDMYYNTIIWSGGRSESKRVIVSRVGELCSEAKAIVQQIADGYLYVFRLRWSGWGGVVEGDGRLWGSGAVGRCGVDRWEGGVGNNGRSEAGEES